MNERHVIAFLIGVILGLLWEALDIELPTIKWKRKDKRGHT